MRIKSYIIHIHYLIVFLLVFCELCCIFIYGILATMLFQNRAIIVLLNHIAFYLALSQLFMMALNLVYRSVLKNDGIIINEYMTCYIHSGRYVINIVGVLYIALVIIIKELNGIENGSDYYYDAARPMIALLISRINIESLSWLHKCLVNL